jgi:hypothetical protein
MFHGKEGTDVLYFTIVTLENHLIFSEGARGGGKRYE